MTDDDQHHPEKQQVNRRAKAADLMGDGRVDLYAVPLERRFVEVDGGRPPDTVGSELAVQDDVLDLDAGPLFDAVCDAA
ncbi:hypothetical protein AB0E12_33110 [Micromonospora chersina]|uniref:hypothetical protein n=1 Tax=Micromonospora chersina TaxID=47854 RepID=UPI0033E59904